METAFTYTLPKLVKPDIELDKPEKDIRWYAYYSISIDGKKQYRKEYGLKNYNISLTKGTLKEREAKASELIERMTIHLKEGRDPKKILAKKKDEQKKIKELEEAKADARISLDKAIDILATEKGWVGEIAEGKEHSARGILSFLKNAFRRYIVKIGKLDDIRQVTKSDIKNLIEEYFNPEDGHVEWRYQTCKGNRGYISILYATLIEKELATFNPASNVKLKHDNEKIIKIEDLEDKYEPWTDEELKIYFKYTNVPEHYKLHVVSKMIMYTFIRPSEIFRLRMSMLDLKEEKFVIPAKLTKSAKRHKKNENIEIDIPDELLVSLKKWVKLVFPDGYKPEDYLIANDKGRQIKHNHYTFDDIFVDVREKLQRQYKGKFEKRLYALKHSGLAKLFYALVNDHSLTPAMVIHTIQHHARHASFLETENYLREHQLQFASTRKKVNFNVLEGLK